MIYLNVEIALITDIFLEKLIKLYQNVLPTAKVTGRRNRMHMLIILSRNYVMDAYKVVLNAITNHSYA